MNTPSLFAPEDLPAVAGPQHYSPRPQLRRNAKGHAVHFTPCPSGRSRKCDDRCTSAKGTDCSCKCGGKNHGIYR